ncbi:MAG: IS4 family transposase [Anaerolineae bacterium]
MSTTHPVVPAPDQHLVGEIESFLAELVADLSPEPPSPSGPGRPRILPALVLWTGLLVCVLRGFTSQLALWRLLSLKGVWHFPRYLITDQAVYARLTRAGTAPLEGFFTQVSAALTERLEPVTDSTLASFATMVAALDTTTLDQIRRKLPSLRGVRKGDTLLLPGKLQAIFDLRRQLWHTIKFLADPNRNDKADARELAASLPKGSLILADLGYFGFPWFDWLTDEGYFWVSRLREKTSYQVMHCYYSQGDTFDGLVWLGVYRADRAAHAVRLVTFRIGERVHRYITNVQDPQQLPPQTLARLYARRWDIEMAFQLIKQHLGLHLLWSAKPVVVQQQILAVLIISQVLQALRLEIAWRAEADPFEVSLPLFIQYAPFLASVGQDPVQVFVEQGRQVGFIRPSRRTIIRAPALPDSYAPLPPGLVLIRTPRYSGRRC